MNQLPGIRRLVRLLAASSLLLTTACGVIRIYRPVSFDQLTREAPFTATVESLTADPFQHEPFEESDFPQVAIFLRKADGGYRLVVMEDWTPPAFSNFARTLEVGKSYAFPQVLFDYLKTHDQEGGEGSPTFGVRP
jgi:hypothetical protein